MPGGFPFERYTSTEPWQMPRKLFIDRYSIGKKRPNMWSDIIRDLPEIGEPGLQIIKNDDWPHEMIYRDNEGKAIAYANFSEISRDHPEEVEEAIENDVTIPILQGLAIDKSRGALSAKAIKEMTDKMDELGILKIRPYIGNMEETKLSSESATLIHHYSVDKALSEGKPVPTDVVTDYPQLIKKYDLNISEVAKEKARSRKEIPHTSERPWEMVKDLGDSYGVMPYREEKVIHFGNRMTPSDVVEAVRVIKMHPDASEYRQHNTQEDIFSDRLESVIWLYVHDKNKAKFKEELKTTLDWGNALGISEDRIVELLTAASNNVGVKLGL